MAAPASKDRAVVIGAGIGGLSAAIDLARQGLAVTVLERAAHIGGKMRTVDSAGAAIDAGPTVLTMRDVFDNLFEDAGASLDGRLTLTPLEILARHAWSDGAGLDLFADIERSTEAIGDFAGAAEARAYRAYCAQARRTFAALEHTFVRAARPSLPQLLWRSAPDRIGSLLGISPFSTLWRDLGRYFKNPRLRQLFARYATYCGASPLQAPATLMLIAHVEQAGVWAVDGGMVRLAQALETLAREKGVAFRLGAHVAEIEISGDAVRGVILRGGDRIEASAVVCNADCAALATGAFGEAASGAVALRNPVRSLSALTWSCLGRARGFDLVRHNVFFSEDYEAEFDTIFRRRRLPENPTVYVCAQDRLDCGAHEGDERLFCLVNAPALGDEAAPNHEELETCRLKATAFMRSCGLTVEPAGPTIVTGPQEFNALFPRTGGALYGQATHGWRASFQRPGSRTKIAGLYVAGGSAHPGAGVPIAAISGRLAAQALMQDLASRARSRRAAMPGGMSTRSAMTGNSA